MDIFLISPWKHMLWYSGAPGQGISNEYPQHMFSWRNKKNINLIPLQPHFPCSKTYCRFLLEWHIKAILMSTHNIYFATKMTKNITKLIFLSMDVNYSSVKTTGNYSPNTKQNIIELMLGTRGTLSLIQEGQLSVSGERMCTILVNRLED